MASCGALLLYGDAFEARGQDWHRCPVPSGSLSSQSSHVAVSGATKPPPHHGAEGRGHGISVAELSCGTTTYLTPSPEEPLTPGGALLMSALPGLLSSCVGGAPILAVVPSGDARGPRSPFRSHWY